MASEQNSVGMNGNYAATQVQGYGGLEQSYNSHSTTSSTTAEYNNTTGSVNPTTNGNGGNPDIPKDEVGWYFVEQYYTTLSRSPEKLFLFYNKRSQYVSGTEAEKVAVCVGQKAINDRIKELDIQDCKVRVTNVDSQGSGSNIVIQVIGEISNKFAPQRKFTQTFVLAEQQNGYFVLNDIFRYILEDEDVVAEEQAHAAPVEADSGEQENVTVAETEGELPHTLTSSDNLAEQARDVELVTEHLEQAIKEEPSLSDDAVPATVNGDEAEESTENIDEEDAPAAPVAAPEEEEEETPAPEADQSIQAEEIVQPEKPKDPEPTPAASPPKPAPAQVSAPPQSKPAVPKTWASLVSGGNRIATPIAPAVPIVPSVASQTSAPAATPKAAQTPAVSAPPAAVPAAPSATVSQEPESLETTQTSGSEWQTAGHDHGKKQGRTQAAQAPAENSRGYIKNVSDAIEPADLRGALSKTAEVTYLDINRQKNCAFVDFASPAGYQAAIAGNPHEINGERLYVEERRIRPSGGFPGAFGGARGGGAPRGRGGAAGGDGRPGGQARGGFQNKEGGRGGFAPRGRGNMGVRGSRGGGVSTAV